MANARTRTSTALTPTLATLGTPGSAGTTPVSDGTALSWGYPAHAQSAYLKPTAALFETFPRSTPTIDSAVLSTGTLQLVAIALPKGLLVSSISFLSGATALSVGANQWFILLDSSRVGLAVTGDDTSAAWSANSIKTLNLASSFTTTYAGLHYLGCMVKATTPPSLRINGSGTATLNGLAPKLGITSTGGQTTPPSPVGSFTGADNGTAAALYAYVS